MRFPKPLAAGLALGLCLGAARATAPGELATHLFPHKDGEAKYNTGGNANSYIEVGRNGTVGWITYVTGGVDLTKTSGASLTLYLAKIWNPGTLKVFALTQPVTQPEMTVEGNNLAYNTASPIATASIAMGDEEKVLRLSLGSLLNQGPFYGVVLESAGGLKADFASKESAVQPLIELRYAFATAEQVQQAIDAGLAAQQAAQLAQQSASQADAAADAAGVAANAAQGYSVLAGQSATAAGASAAAAGASATQAATSATAAAGSAGAASGSAHDAGLAADAATAAAGQSSASAGQAASSASAASASAAAATGPAQDAPGYASAAGAAAGEANTAAGAAATAASAAAGSASAAGASATTATGAATAATGSAQDAAGSAQQAAGYAATAGTSAGSCSAAAGAAATSAGAAATSADAAAASAAAAAASSSGSGFPTGTALLTSSAVPPAGFVQTGVRTNYESSPGTGANSGQARYDVASDTLGGKLYISGGYNGSSHLSLMQTYDPATNLWATVAGMPTVNHEHTMTGAEGYMYAIAGALTDGTPYTGVFRYNPATNSWATMASLPSGQGRFYHAAAYFNGKIYVFGGNNTWPGLARIATTWAYDIATNTWTQKASIPTPRGVLTASVLNGKIYLIGGNDGAGVSAVVEIYDPAANTWSTGVPLPSGRSHHSSITGPDGRIYVFGGSVGGSINLVSQFDPVNNTWASLQPLQTARYKFGAGFINGKFYLAQGYSNQGGGILSSLETITLPKTVYLVEKQ